MDFFSDYFKYVGPSEAPKQFHRWCAIGAIGAVLGRNVYFPFGHKCIYPNQYILLLGAPGTRKSSAIGIAKTAMEKAGYKKFAKEHSSKERFFVDLSRSNLEVEDEDVEAFVIDAPSEVTIANGEFLDFIGNNNMGFLTALTNMWDCLPIYEHPKLHGKSVIIDKPTVNILGGATVKGLGLAIPPEALGTGILSRLILIYADMTTVKIAFPPPVDRHAESLVVEALHRMRNEVKGEMAITDKARDLMERMYKEYPGIDDARFVDYSARRFIHLLKLTMIVSIAYGKTTIDTEDALIANTILHNAERRMPKALGEFGKSKYSDVANTIMDALERTHKPLSHSDLWKIVAKDLSDVRELGNVMKNLLTSERVQIITSPSGKQGYLPLNKVTREWPKDLLLEGYLTEEEEL